MGVRVGVRMSNFMYTNNKMDQPYTKDTKEWGPHYWYVMESVAYFYSKTPSPQDKKSANDFYNSLINLLPCGMCKFHYNKVCKQYPINVSNRSSLIEWVDTIKIKLKELEEKYKAKQKNIRN